MENALYYKGKMKNKQTKRFFDNKIKGILLPKPKFDSKFNSVSKVHQLCSLFWLISTYDYWQLFLWKIDMPLSLLLPGAVKLYIKGEKYSLWSCWWTNAMNQDLMSIYFKGIEAIHICHITIIITEFCFQIKLFAEESKMIQYKNAYYATNG